MSLTLEDGDTIILASVSTDVSDVDKELSVLFLDSLSSHPNLARLEVAMIVTPQPMPVEERGAVSIHSLAHRGASHQRLVTARLTVGSQGKLQVLRQQDFSFHALVLAFKFAEGVGDVDFVAHEYYDIGFS